ncbi:MAG TPA: four helix bundle protein [Pirellulaceae bacterium]|nr:four helix bundle protein [Pirellulaceae bacterium]
MGIRRHTELDVYKRSFEAAMLIYNMTKSFPQEERYSLVDQIRRSSRSVSANLAEAWRKRRYEAAFIAKLSDCESEAAETQVWLQFSVECGYASRENAKALYSEYDELIAMLVHMINHAAEWTIK